MNTAYYYGHFPKSQKQIHKHIKLQVMKFVAEFILFRYCLELIFTCKRKESSHVGGRMTMEKECQSNVYLLLLSAQVLRETGSSTMKSDKRNISFNSHFQF